MLCRLPTRAGEAAPFVAVLRHIQDGVQHAQVGQADIAALRGQAVPDLLVPGFGDFHVRGLHQRTGSRLLVLP